MTSNALSIFVTLWGSLPAALFLALCACPLSGAQGGRAVLGVILASALSNLVKFLRFRPRPDNPTGERLPNPLDEAGPWTLKRLIAFAFYVDQGSFPSVHAARSFFLAWVFAAWLHSCGLGVLFFVLAALVAWSRVIRRRHHVSDVLAGALLGCLLGWGLA